MQDLRLNRLNIVTYLIWQSIPKMSTVPSRNNCVIPVANAIKQPVLPIPALQCTIIGPGNVLISAASPTNESAV